MRLRQVGGRVGETIPARCRWFLRRGDGLVGAHRALFLRVCGMFCHEEFSIRRIRTLSCPPLPHAVPCHHHPTWVATASLCFSSALIPTAAANPCREVGPRSLLRCLPLVRKSRAPWAPRLGRPLQPEPAPPSHPFPLLRLPGLLAPGPLHLLPLPSPPSLPSRPLSDFVCFTYRLTRRATHSSC